MPYILTVSLRAEYGKSFFCPCICQKIAVRASLSVNTLLGSSKTSRDHRKKSNQILLLVFSASANATESDKRDLMKELDTIK